MEVVTKFADGRCDLHLLAINNSIPKCAFWTKYLQSTDKHKKNSKIAQKPY